MESLNTSNIQSMLSSLPCHDFLGDRGDFGEDVSSSKLKEPDSPPCEKEK